MPPAARQRKGKSGELPYKSKTNLRLQKRKRHDQLLEELQSGVDNLDTKNAPCKEFSDLPLSDETRLGLKAAHFKKLTDIQTKAIPLALKGCDVLGAAKTGSGKTLAFLVPVLENLYREQCIGAEAGLAAMIISPTRELAIQIFDVLVKIGKHGHTFSAGLVIGGKSLAEEQAPLRRMNIVVCTPGRILQHLSQTSYFNVDNLKMLVLDEADRILDMGFQHDVDAILEYLPREGRQTLLFSATQTKRVSDLARLSLKDPEYVSVHEQASTSTPRSLQQNYIVAPLQDKLDTLWSFLQTAKKQKTLVFLSSGKQVRFIYETFCKLQPGVPLLHLLGKQKQTTRLQITRKFSSARMACLFATDVAARGLDFPAVDWVVQVDCPEDADTYIHRAGRTARFERDGRAMLFLTPGEEAGMLERLAAKRVPIERVEVRQRKQSSIKERLQMLCFRHPELKYLGQKAFLSYVRSIQVQQDKGIFGNVEDLPLEEFAGSFGLRIAPKIKATRTDGKALKNRSRQAMQELGELDGEEAENKNAVRTKYDRMFERQNQDILADHYRDLIPSDEELGGDDDGGGKKALPVRGDSQADKLDGASSSEDDDHDFDLLSVKRRIQPDDEDVTIASDAESGNDANGYADPDASSKARIIQPDGFAQPITIDSKRRAKLLSSKKAVTKLKSQGMRLVYDEESGEMRPVNIAIDEAAFRKEGAPEDLRRKFVEQEGVALMERDATDKDVARERRRAKKQKKKDRERGGDYVEEDEAGVEADDDRGEDLLANFMADAESDDHDYNDDVGDARSVDSNELPTDRPRKWFEEEVLRPKRKTKAGARRAREEALSANVTTLEDMEAAAAGLLG